MQTPQQNTNFSSKWRWIIAKSNGEPTERFIAARFKKALMLYETEEAIDNYVASRSDIFSIGALHKKKQIPIAQILEILRRRDDCALVSVDYDGDDGEIGLCDRVEYANALADVLLRSQA